MQSNKKMPYLEQSLIVLAAVAFLLISSVIMFKRDWLDSLFNGSEQATEDSLFGVTDGVYHVLLKIMPGEKGEAFVYLDLESSANVGGLEVKLAKDAGLNIKEFICAEPFECIDFTSESDSISFVTIVPLDFERDISQEILLGKFLYDGTGELFLNSENSVIATSDDSKLKFIEAEYIL